MANSLLPQTRQFYRDSIVELVGHYAGEEPTVFDWMPEQPASWAEIEVGFGGFQMSGASKLAADPAVTACWSLGPVEDPVDWLGELNNQLVSRLKSKLLRVGVTVQLSTPADSSGGLLVVGAARPEPACWVAEWSGGRFAASLSVAVASHVVFTDAQQDAALQEGSHCLF